MQLTSPVFHAEGRIPADYTAEGRNISPSLAWHDIPDGAKSFALIMEDPDAPSGIFTHWLAFDIPANRTRLAEAEHEDLKQGKNDFGDVGYGGPKPPEGHGPHRYYFKLYALDRELMLDEGIEKEALLEAMEGRVLDDAELMGIYEIT